MLVQMTFGVLVLCVLSTSYHVTQYRAVKSDNSEVLCATSPPNKTINAVTERTKCTIECSRGCQSPCHAINYRQTTQLCELFYYEPCFYDLQPDCYNYKVVNNTQLLNMFAQTSVVRSVVLYFFIIQITRMDVCKSTVHFLHNWKPCFQ